MVTQYIRLQYLCGLDTALSPRTPEGTSPVGSPRRISRLVPPPLRGLKGGIQVRPIEYVKRIIALI